MRKLEIKDAEIMRMALQQKIPRSGEPRDDHWLYGVLLVCSGCSCYDVAEMAGHGLRTIQYWVQCFEQTAFAGL